MPAYQINDDEREALRGLPMLSREIYVFGLRPFMDYSTGIVGARRGVSWKSIAEELYVEPHQGIKGGEPTEKELRRALAWLQKVELLSENMAERRLIFELLKASRDKSARNKVGSKWADEVGSYVAPPQPNNHAGLPEEEGRQVGGGELPKVGTPPESGFLPTLRHPAHEDQPRFPMHDDWEPTTTGWKATALRNGLGAASASDELLLEFRSYWINRPEKYQSQGQWEHELAQKLKREVRHAQRPGSTQAETNQTRPTSSRPDRQGPRSAVDRVRANIAANEAARQAVGTAVDENDRNVRPPLDVEFWRQPEP